MDGQERLIWAWDSDAGEWVKVKADAQGRLQTVAAIDELDDIGDVYVPTPTDGYILYWNDGNSRWECKAVPIAAHKDTHDPIDGSDKLDTAAPVKVGEANAIGSSHSFPRADHVHEKHHAKYTDAEAVTAAKTVKLDDFTAPDDNTDLDASAAKHGLMPKADSSKLAGIAAGADVTGSNPPQAHKDLHDPQDGADKLDTAAPSTVGVANATGSGHSFARNDHIHKTGAKLLDADDDTKVDVEESGDEDIVRMDVAGTEAFHLSAIGILSLAKQSRARASLTGAAQKLPDNTGVIVRLDTEDFDNQNEFNSTVTTSTATATTSGATIKDSTNPFVEGDVGKVVWNNTDGKTTTIAAYVAADQVVLAADIDIDEGDSYSFGYSRFTAKEAGYYAVVGSVHAEMDDAERLITMIYKNGAKQAQAGYHSSWTSWIYTQASDIFYLAASDYVELWGYANGATEIGASAYATFLSVHKIS